MAKDKKQGILKNKNVYKRARNIAIIFAVVSAFLILVGIGAGIYSAKNNTEILSEYKRDGQYREIYLNDVRDLKEDYISGKIDIDEYKKQFSYMRSDNDLYVLDNLNRSESEIKEKSDQNNLMMMAGIAAIGVGFVGAVASGTAACKKDDQYDDAVELEKREN